MKPDIICRPSRVSVELADIKRVYPVANYLQLMYDEVGGMSVLTNWYGIDAGIGVHPQFVGNGVRALFSFRHHPIASDIGLDVGFHDRTAPEITITNREFIAESLDEPLSHFTFVRQVHGANVLLVKKQHRGLGATDEEMDLPQADAMITNQKQSVLAILTADCVSVMFYDSVANVIGVAHSGWRGTVAHISSRVVETMCESYGSKPENIRVSMGPSIRQCCYEVDDVVADPVRQAFSPSVLCPRFGHRGKYWLSLHAAIRADLQRSGIPDLFIEDTGVCTSCRVNHLFSHRREHGATGRQMAAIVLK